MTALAILAIVGALLLTVMKRFGASLVLMALVVVSFGNEYVSGGEWILFWVVFIIGLVVTLGIRRPQEASAIWGQRKYLAIVGAIVFLVSIFMVVGWPWQWKWLGHFGWGTLIIGILLLAGAAFLVLRNVLVIGVVVTLVGVMFVGIGLLSLPSNNGRSSAPPPPTKTVTPKPKVIRTGPSATEVAKAIEKDLRKKGFKPNEWSATPNWSRNPADVNRQFSFSGQTLRSQQDVANFLNGSSEGSRLARQQVLSTLHGVDRQRALSGQGYVPIQFKIGVQYGGNTYKSGDKIITPHGLRQARPGDVIWVFIRSNGTIDWAASVRADCGNGSFMKIIPVRPNTPTVPSVTCVFHCVPPPPPVCPPSMPYGHWPICKDGPQNDPGAKGNAPIGSGRNKNPGPGVYQPSPASKGPSHPYTPPASPQPSKTPRPTPAPSPAPGAPAPSDAPTSCAPPPGMTHC